MLKSKFRALIPFFLVIIVLLIFLNHMETNPFKGFFKKQDVFLPTELHPIVKERSDQLIQQAAAKGIVIMITDDFRSAEDQDRLYEKGRTAQGNIVTYAKGGESFHNLVWLLILRSRPRQKMSFGICNTMGIKMEKLIGMKWLNSQKL